MPISLARTAQDCKPRYAPLAAELLAFIGHQPSSDYATRTTACRLLDEVSAQLTPEALTEAQARGRADTLETMLAT
jgi:hypothetical protein